MESIPPSGQLKLWQTFMKIVDILAWIEPIKIEEAKEEFYKGADYLKVFVIYYFCLHGKDHPQIKRCSGY